MMNQVSDMTAPVIPNSAQSKNLWLWTLLLASVGLVIFIYWDSLVLMVEWWEHEEYSHGYMIPFVALFLFWQRINSLPAVSDKGSWLGFAMVGFGLTCFFLGELSAIYTLIQYGFLLSFAGVALAFFGRAGLRLEWAAFFYLIFMIPLPSFFYFNLSSQLQLLSSLIGVAVIRLFNISVHLEGNVIDLGSMQLQVAEACSGLRYLFPLMSFGFLIGYLYRGPIWQRITIFLSTIPITVLMNSFRIGIIGVTVDKWGIEMAKGFLHDFEGWVVFMGCVGLLFLEIALFQLFSPERRRVFDLVNLDVPKLSIKLSNFNLSPSKQRPFLAVFALLLIIVPYFATLQERSEVTPQRKSFSNFPLEYKTWTGKESTLDQDIVGTLKFSDYIIADYRADREPIGVNFYVAWYESQKKGASIHSPRSCIPGGGWRIESLSQQNIPNIMRHDGHPLRVNRALIQKGDVINVVYYWFEGRGRDVTNEYMAKWYIFWDSLTQSRTDGALIRVVTTVTSETSIAEADERLGNFLKDFYPLIPTYVP